MPRLCHRRPHTAALAVCAAGFFVREAAAVELPKHPNYTLSEVTVVSSVDGSEEPVIIGHPAEVEPGESDVAARPLLVGIHSWSTDRFSSTAQQSKQAAERGWLAVFPEFRGPNRTSNPRATEAGGSLLAQHDIIDAVEYMKANFAVDKDRIYIMGGSGGGHMSLLMACKYPDVWAGCSSWVPITSMQEWWEQQNGYAVHVEAVCGGKPGDSAEVDYEYLRRSPRTFITNAMNTPVRISHGQMDSCIWVKQTWDTFSELAKLAGHQVSFFSDAHGHHADFAAGAAWLEGKVRSSKPPQRQQLVTDEAKWYFWCYVVPARAGVLARIEAGIAERDDEVVLEVSSEGARELRIDLGALGISLTDDADEVVREVLRLKPDASSGKSSYSYRAVRE
jgi:dienelactone hydrolase